jgi:hypothetical protein
VVPEGEGKECGPGAAAAGGEMKNTNLFFFFIKYIYQCSMLKPNLTLIFVYILKKIRKIQKNMYFQ